MKSAAELPERLQLKLSQLNRAIFSRESGGAARLFGELIEEVPDLALRPVVHYDLARLLELGGDLPLALKAFEGVIKFGGQGDYHAPALRQAGHICWRTKQLELAYEYLTAFLETNPSRAEKMDAEEILSRIPPGARRVSKANKLPPRPSTEDNPKPPPVSKPAPKVSSAPPPPPPSDPSVIMIGGLDMADPSAPPPKAAPRRAAEVPKSSAARMAMPAMPEKAPPAADFAAPPPPIPEPRRPSGEFSSPPLPPPSTARKSSGEVAKVAPPSPKSGEFPREFARANRSAAPIPETSKAPEKAPKFESPPPPTPKSLARQEATGEDSGPQVAPPRGVSPAKFVGSAAADSSGIGPSAYALSTPPEMEPPERRYARLRGASFALLLPIGKRIHIEAVAELVAKHDQLEESAAKKAVISRKGIIYDQLTVDEVIEIWPLVKECRQALVFAHVDRTLRPYELFEVLGAEALPPGLKMTTEKGIKKARWVDLKLVGAGTIDGHATIDVFCGVPLKHYRFQEGLFNFRTIAESARKDQVRGLIDFVQILCEQAPKAIRTHTLENLRSAGTGKPQAFTTLEEFDCYNRWQLFSHYAEAVDVGELSEQYKSMSNW